MHAGVAPDAATGGILTPIHQSTTFVQESIDAYMAKGYSYSRTTNPTVAVLEAKVAELEGAAGAAASRRAWRPPRPPARANQGRGAVVRSTAWRRAADPARGAAPPRSNEFAGSRRARPTRRSMCAQVTVMSAFLSQGDHCVLTDCSYGGTNRAARELFGKFGVEFSFVDFRDADAVAAACRPNTKLVFSETPANPTLTLTDLAAVSAVARARGALHCCDATFATPLMLRPLALGCDLSLHSTTKYFDGHNMTVGGVVSAKTAALAERLHFWRNVHGNIMAPHTAFLTLQSSKTMGVRCRAQAANALKVATFLETHPKVARVVYPGLASFPQAELAARQHAGGFHGGMLWCEVKGGSAAGRRLMDTCQRPWSLCENLGAVESIITCPSVMTHANMLPEDRLKVGITDGFIRLSCGVEDAGDLVRALKIALDAL